MRHRRSSPLPRAHPRPRPASSGGRRNRATSLIKHPARICALATLPAALACSSAFRDIAATPAQSATQADQLFEGFADRFHAVVLEPRYDAARLKLAKSALVPSRIFDDTTVWQAPLTGTTRRTYGIGGLEDGHYRLESRPAITPVARVGDTRHTIALQQVAPSVYRWETDVELAIGSITPRGMSVLISGLLGAPVGKTEAQARADYRATVPRATAAFGRGFSIDSLRIVPAGGGITSVATTIGFHPETMRAAFPAFAGYLDKYLGPAKYHFVVADRAGVPLLDIAGRDRALTARYRLQDGRLTTLVGAPRPWPDTLVLTADVSLKVKFFTVGFRKLVTELVLSETPRERAWTVIAQHEPEWDLPLVTERLIRTPLHRPFEGAGSMFRVAVRDSAGGQTVFDRRARLDVQESAIMRFIGSLGAHAVGDLDTKVEAEEDRFLYEGFSALQADVRALRPPTGRPND